jgi:biopolymer transport protein ExbB/TolQ/DNA-binding transcriptional MerR regulator
MQSKYSGSLCLANYIVIALIPILFFLVMLLGYMQIIPLNIPIYGLGIIAFILFVFLLFIKHNANYSICKIRASHLKMEKVLEKKLDESALTIEGKTKSILDLKIFLNNYYDDVRNNNFAAVASSIFPMLGILGTFIAIALSMPNFSVEDTQALDHEISMLLNGVGSAFFASIYGILLSLIWTYFEKRGISKIEHYFNEVQKNYKKYLFSKEELTIYKYTQYDIKENRFIAALQETFNLDFIRQMNEHNLASFEKVTAQTTYNFHELTNKLKDVSHELTQTLQEMDRGEKALNAQNHIDKALVDFTVATRSFEKTTKLFSTQLENSLDRTFDKIDSEIGEIVIKLADFATHVSLESSEVQNSIARYHKMVADQLKEK